MCFYDLQAQLLWFSQIELIVKLSLNELGDYISIFGFHEEMDYDRNILSEIFHVYDHNCHRYKLDDDNIFLIKVINKIHINHTGQCLCCQNLLLCFFCTGLLAVLTIPVLYEKYESYVERYVNIACMELRHRYESYTKHLNKVKNWILEKKEKLG